MDALIRTHLAELHIQELLDEADARRAHNVQHTHAQDLSTRCQMLATCAYHRLRRQLGVLLIQVGRRLANGDPSPAYHAYGNPHR
jgi:hypothetical protein